MDAVEEWTDGRLYSLSKVRPPQWPGLKVGVYMCLCLQLCAFSHPPFSVRDPRVRGGSTSKASPFAARTMAVHSKSRRRTETRDKNILSDRRVPIGSSRHRLPSSARLGPHPPTTPPPPPPARLYPRYQTRLCELLPKHAGIELGETELPNMLEL